MRWLGKRGSLAIVLFAIVLSGWLLYLRNQPRGPADQAAALFAQVQPHLEAVLGPLPFKPEFRSITREQLSRLALADAEAYLRFRFPHLEGAELIQAAVSTRRAFAEVALAARVPASNVIYVLDESEPKLTQLALVHEAACAALEVKRPAAEDSEQLLASQAFVEGKALQVTTEIARCLGTEALIPKLTDRLLQVSDSHLDPGLRTVTQAALRQRHWAMTQGREFVRYLAERKIDEGLIAARPPRQIEWINRPEKYVRALHDNRPDLRDLLAKVENSLPAPWMPFHQAWTAEMVLQVAGLINDKAGAEKYVAQWQEGRTLVWSRKDNPNQHVAVSVARFTKPNDARSYFNFAVELQRKQDVAAGDSCGLPFVVVQSKSSPFSHDAIEEAVINSRLLRTRNGQAVTPANTLLARKDDSVVEITWHGAPADLALAQDVISKLLAK